MRAGSSDDSRHERTRCSCLSRNSRVGTARGYLDICFEDEGDPKDCICVSSGSCFSGSASGMTEAERADGSDVEERKGDILRPSRVWWSSLLSATKDATACAREGRVNVPRLRDELSHWRHLIVT